VESTRRNCQEGMEIVTTLNKDVVGGGDYDDDDDDNLHH
jgi:hypothetical protein